MDLNDVDFDEDFGIKKEEINEKLVKLKKEIFMWVKVVCLSLISEELNYMYLWFCNFYVFSLFEILFIGWEKY